MTTDDAAPTTGDGGDDDFAGYVASTRSTPRPGWTTLDTARRHRFTGMLSFATMPEIRVYLDDGEPYWAGRADDPPLGRQLVDSRAIDSAQLERSMVRVGDAEHLGRMFDRDPSIDRDAVLVVVESSTENVIQSLANSVTASVSAMAYQHHPNGIRQWFRPTTAPAAQTATLPSPQPSEPSNAPSNAIGTEVTDDTTAPVAHTGATDATEVEDLPAAVSAESPVDWDGELPELVESSEPAEALDDDHATADEATPANDVGDADQPLAELDGDRRSTSSTGRDGHDESGRDAIAADGDTDAGSGTVGPVDGSSASTPATPERESMLPGVPDAVEVPESVVSAVQRALSAIELGEPDDRPAAIRRSAGPASRAISLTPMSLRDTPFGLIDTPEIARTGSPSTSPVDSDDASGSDTASENAADDTGTAVSDSTPTTPTDITTEGSTTDGRTSTTTAAPVPAPTPTPALAPGSFFPPPTPDMRAEVIYARAAAAAGIDYDPTAERKVDDSDPEARAGRAGALRRLIGSLRG